MTAPAPAVEPAVEAAVAAEAIVRAANGRSILDRTGMEPNSRYAADPDRMAVVVRTLVDNGLHIEDVGATTIRFRGRRQGFEDAFGVTLAPTAAGEPLPWSVAGHSGFDATSGPLGGQVHRVELRLPAEIPVVLWEFSRQPPRDRDLLLGDARAALAPGGLSTAGRAGMTIPQLRTGTTTSLQAWATDRLYRSLVEHVELLGSLSTKPARAADARPAGPVVLAVVENSGPPGIGYWFDRMAGRTDEGSGVRFTQTGTPEHVRGMDADEEVLADALQELDRACSRIGGHVAGIEALLVEWGSARARPAKSIAGDIYARRWAFENDMVAFPGIQQSIVAAALPAPPGWEDPAAWTGSAWQPVWNAAEVVDLQTVDRLVRAMALTPKLAGWAADARDRAAKLGLNARESRRQHGAMTTFSALAVTGGLVDVRFLCGPDRYDEARRLLAGTGRVVVSMSWGDPGPYDYDRWKGRTHPIVDVTKRTTADGVLVVAAGNKSQKRDLPNLDAILLGSGERTLVAGGTVPAGQGWARSDETHGYTVRTGPKRPPGVRPVTVTVPTVCGPTRGSEGGGLWVPILPATPAGGVDVLDRWTVGGGSSQAAPLVAAVAALVWSGFPELTGPQVRDAVRRGVEAPSTGTFHRPEIDADVDMGWDGTGDGRVVLAEALRIAQQLANQPFADDLSDFLAPAVATS